jgi:hypothetical protein
VFSPGAPQVEKNDFRLALRKVKGKNTKTRQSVLPCFPRSESTALWDGRIPIYSSGKFSTTSSKMGAVIIFDVGII